MDHPEFTIYYNPNREVLETARVKSLPQPACHSERITRIADLQKQKAHFRKVSLSMEYLSDLEIQFKTGCLVQL